MQCLQSAISFKKFGWFHSDLYCRGCPEALCSPLNLCSLPARPARMGLLGRWAPDRRWNPWLRVGPADRANQSFPCYLCMTSQPLCYIIEKTIKCYLPSRINVESNTAKILIIRNHQLFQLIMGFLLSKSVCAATVMTLQL